MLLIENLLHGCKNKLCYLVLKVLLHNYIYCKKGEKIILSTADSNFAQIMLYTANSKFAQIMLSYADSNFTQLMSSTADSILIQAILSTADSISNAFYYQ